jgi:hypothetical protein|tara:strand:- start:3754 stop:4068 length:315 start_codon:yes stop_codon:yes gene_type:complete
MIIKVNFNVGSNTYQITVEEQKELETLHKAIVLSNPRKYCNVCENNRFFRLDSNKAEGKGNNKGSFTYINNVCTKCGAKSNLGQYKAGGYFWKEFEKYEPKEKK